MGDKTSKLNSRRMEVRLNGVRGIRPAGNGKRPLEQRHSILFKSDTRKKEIIRNEYESCDITCLSKGSFEGNLRQISYTLVLQRAAELTKRRPFGGYDEDTRHG